MIIVFCTGTCCVFGRVVFLFFFLLVIDLICLYVPDICFILSLSLSLCLTHPTESWYHFNDSTVTETTPENVSNSHAYILFYVQRNINSKYSNNDATCTTTSSSSRSSTIQQSLSPSPSPSSLALRTATGRLIRTQRQSPTPFRAKRRSETITPT